MADPLEVVAGEISDESILLCVDEFMVCWNLKLELWFLFRLSCLTCPSFLFFGLLLIVLILWSFLGD